MLPKRDIAAEIGCSTELTRSRIIWNSTCWTRSRSVPKVCEVCKLKPGASAMNHAASKSEKMTNFEYGDQVNSNDDALQGHKIPDNKVTGITYEGGSEN